MQTIFIRTGLIFIYRYILIFKHCKWPLQINRASVMGFFVVSTQPQNPRVRVLVAITISRHFSTFHRCIPSRFISFSTISYSTTVGISSSTAFRSLYRFGHTTAIAVELRARSIVYSQFLRSFTIFTCNSSTNYLPRSDVNIPFWSQPEKRILQKYLLGT